MSHSEVCRYFTESEETAHDDMTGSRQTSRSHKVFFCDKTSSTTGPDGKGCNRPGPHAIVPACQPGRDCYEARR